MNWNLKTNNSWAGGQKKNLQKMLNTFGFTDAGGNKLAEDGVIGPKTTAAIGKLNRYQSESSAPSGKTRELQKQLNEFGFKDASGKALKEDGVYGPKTDAVNNDFENNFLDGVTGGRNTAKTVQKGIYPSLPQITQKDVESVITPKSASKTDPMANQKNPDGTWKQVAAPGAWSGSGGTSANEQKLFDTAKTAQEITARIQAGRVQGGYKETGGAQSQAYQGRVPDITYDKIKPGTYTDWTETGGAQGQAASVFAPSTGNEGIDMLLGKGKYTGVYNNLNRPSDKIILEKTLESVKLPKSANMMYNEADKRNTGSLAGFNALSASGDSTAQANQKNPDGTWKQVATPGAWSGSGVTNTNEQKLFDTAKTAQEITARIQAGRVQGGYKETGGAQGQAITSRKSDTSNNNAIIKADNDEVNYEPNNSNIPFIGRNQLQKEGSFTVDFVEEKNRNEALDKVGVLNTFLDYKLAPIFNAIKNANKVSFESSQKELTIQDKRNEEIRKSSEDVSKLYTSADILDVATEIFKVIPVTQIVAAFTWPGEYVTKVIAENVDNNKTDDASKQYTGYDKQGDRIDIIYQESINLSYSNDGIFGESNIGSSDIVYEYHIVDGLRRILSITINGHQVYNDYQNQ